MLRDDLELTRDRPLQKLAETHDYFIYTKGAWQTLRKIVRRDSLRFVLRNGATGTAVSANDLLARAQRYIADDFASATLQQFVSTFENFLSDALRLWLLAYPKTLSSRQLSGKEILSLPDKSAIIDALVEQELRDVSMIAPQTGLST